MNIFYVILLIRWCSVFGTEEKQWIQYKIEYNKSYYTPQEECHRFNIFKNNLKEISDHNENFEKGQTTYQMSVNKFADLTVSEYCDQYKMFPKKTFIYNDTPSTSNEIEHGENKKNLLYLNWSEKGAVTSVKNQEKCGSCWIFSAIGLLEGFYFRKFNKLISFSEQNIVDCISNTSCWGGWPPRVLDYVEKHGIVKEEEYPYEGRQGKCRHDTFQNIHIPFKQLVHVKNSESSLKEAVTDFGPLIVCVYASSKWRFYKSGVWYEQECSNDSNHAMVLVGFGNENGSDYWLVKNSMGKDWGDNGYIKIARNKHHNYCGITETAFYLI